MFGRDKEQEQKFRWFQEQLEKKIDEKLKSAREENDVKLASMFEVYRKQSTEKIDSQTQEIRVIVENHNKALKNACFKSDLKSLEEKFAGFEDDVSKEFEAVKQANKPIDTSQFIREDRFKEVVDRIYFILNDLAKKRFTKEEIKDLKQKLASGIRGEEWKKTLERYNELKKET